MSSKALLQWYALAGVDECVEATPQNRLHAKAPKQSEATVAPAPSGAPEVTTFQPQTANEPMARTPSALTTPSAAMAEARALANSAKTVAELEKVVRGFDGCVLKRTATNTVFSDGDPKARLMLIGEAPGANEDEQGIPFCGMSGELLNAMLKAIGISRDECLITNTVYWRPPGNRQPSKEELAICRPFVEKHVALVNPRILVFVGGVAASSMLNTTTGITKLRGRTHDYTTPYLDKPVPSAVLFHPSYLMRSPGQKRLAWQDLLFLKDYLAK